MYISVLNKDDAIKYTPQASLKNMQDIKNIIMREMWSLTTVRRTDYLLFKSYFGYNFRIRISSREE